MKVMMYVESDEMYGGKWTFKNLTMPTSYFSLLQLKTINWETQMENQVIGQRLVDP